MSAAPDDVRAYYDAHVEGKLRGWLAGNPRVEAAWHTLKQWAPPAPRRVLEVGCGIGDITARLRRRYPAAQVVGLDISPRSIELAQRLFAHTGAQFLAGTLAAARPHGPFDLIVGFDVYEHIAEAERPAFDALLGQLLSPEGRLILSFPTPRHQDYYRRLAPDRLQPVDEDISPATLQALAQRSGTELWLYQEVDIWSLGDYAHAVLARPDAPWQRMPPKPPPAPVYRLLARLAAALRQPWVHLRLAQARRRLRG